MICFIFKNHHKSSKENEISNRVAKEENKPEDADIEKSEEKIEDETVSKPIEINLDINKCSKYNLQYSSCMGQSIRHNMDKDKKE
ncbi:hypothetical protein CN402_11650 [Bacillus sp. AFS015896]|nr:hypothetical protein CN402_11650 [Bacillus sp. AFS015896]